MSPARQAALVAMRQALADKRAAGTIVYKPRKKREKKKVEQPFHKGRFLLDEDGRLTIMDLDGDHGVELEPEVVAKLREFLARTKPAGDVS